MVKVYLHIIKKKKLLLINVNKKVLAYSAG